MLKVLPKYICILYPLCVYVCFIAFMLSKSLAKFHHRKNIFYFFFFIKKIYSPDHLKWIKAHGIMWDSIFSLNI